MKLKTISLLKNEIVVEFDENDNVDEFVDELKNNDVYVFEINDDEIVIELIDYTIELFKIDINEIIDEYYDDDENVVEIVDVVENIKNEFEIEYVEINDDYDEFVVVYDSTTLNTMKLIKFIELNLMKYTLNIKFEYGHEYNDELIVKIVDELKLNDDILNNIELYKKFDKLYDDIKIVEINNDVVMIKFNEIDVDNVKMNIKHFFNVDVEIYDDVVVI